MATVGARSFLSLLLLCISCGTQGDASVLPDRWPRSGLSGYAFFDADDPEFLAQPGWDLDQPAAATGTDGALYVFGRMAMSRGPALSQLFASRAASLDAPDEPISALEATLPWEGGGLRGPSIADAELPLLFYQAEDGSIGLADRDGATLRKRSLDAPLISAAQLGLGRKVGRAACVYDPGLAGGQLRIYYTVDDVEVYVAVAAAEPVLRAGSTPAPVAIDWQVRPVGLFAAQFNVPPGDAKAVPAERILELSARRIVTPAGRVRWDLFLVAAAKTDSALVAASAYAEGTSGFGERFSISQVPLIKTTDGTLLSPTVSSFAGRPLLLVGLRQVQTVIAAAVLP